MRMTGVTVAVTMAMVVRVAGRVMGMIVRRAGIVLRVIVRMHRKGILRASAKFGIRVAGR